MKSGKDSGPVLMAQSELSLQQSITKTEYEISNKASLEFLMSGPLLADALIENSAKVSTSGSTGSTLTIDVSHTLDRDYDDGFSPDFAAVDTKHTFNGNINLERTFKDVRMTLDAGAKTVLHQDLVRIGFSSFDRAAQDYFEPEVAARFAFLPDKTVNPFFELAFVGRQYFNRRDVLRRDRDFQGPEIIAGVEIWTEKLSGQLAVIHAWRKLAESGAGRTSVTGPYIDLTWRPTTRTEIIFAAASSFAQESSGDIAIYPIHAAHVEMAASLTDDFRLATAVDVKYEDFADGGGTLTITPDITATWSLHKNVDIIAAVGGEWSKSPATAATLELSAKAGVKFNLN
jgi:hypothetical protein